MDKKYFQDIHYKRRKPNYFLDLALSTAEFFYKSAINFKNKLYEEYILKEQKMPCEVICVGNLTTGGVGKTPIVSYFANELSKNAKVAIVSRGYKSKLDTKDPIVIKDKIGLCFFDGTICGDEPFEHAKNTNDDVIVIVCSDRKKALDYLNKNYRIDIAILDDGFSNRTIKKNKSIVVVDSKMRFGNGFLLPKGPLREPVAELKRADEIILVDKNDENIDEAMIWAETLCDRYNLKLSLAKIEPDGIYNISNEQIVDTAQKTDAIAFCAIGQPGQFFDFARNYYNLKDTISFEDHYDYSVSDIKNIITKADEFKINTFITTKKDETKIIPLLKEIENIENYSFNTLKLKVDIKDIELQK